MSSTQVVRVLLVLEELEEEITEKKLRTAVEVKTEKIDNTIAQISPFHTIKLDIDIPAINAMCTKYLVQKKKLTWKNQNHLFKSMG